MPWDKKHVTAIIEVLKKRFNNLSAIELVNLAMDICQAIEDTK